MKQTVFILIVFLPFLADAQEIKGVGGIGYANATLPDAKRIIFYAERGFAYEFTSHKKLYLQAGIKLGTYQFNGIDSIGKAVLDKRQFLSLPVYIRRYYLLRNNGSFFLNIGLVANYNFLHSSESRKPDISLKQRNNGFALSVSGGAGYKKMFSGGSYGIEVALEGSFDVLNKYDNELDYLKSNRHLVLISFLKKINR